MPKSLSFDAILAALAVLSLGTEGCSKSDSAAPAPETNTPASRTSGVNAATPPPPVVVAAPPPTPTTEGAPSAAPVAAAAAAVDAGKELTPSKPQQKKAGASCGATGCSPDMKKNK